MVFKFGQFISEMSDSGHLLFYSFDWDDNILFMPTKIHMDQLVDGKWLPKSVSTSDFAEVRVDRDNWRIRDNDPDLAFSEFRDFGSRGETAFLQDVKSAISQEKFGPSWDDFIECMVNGSVFSIITARGHESGPMRMGIEWIIDNILTESQLYEMYNNLLKFAYLFKEDGEFDRILKGKPSSNKLVKIYLDNCDFVGVSAPSRGGSPDKPELAKEEALLEFKAKIDKFAASIGVKAKVGFSDDDLGNVKHVEDLVDNINRERFPNIVQYVVKGTKDPDSITKKVRITETSHQAPGLESSVMAFTQFNNMTNRLYPKGPEGRQDDFANKMRREVEFLAKNSKNILKDSKKKKRKDS
jgi:hypothetical protein